MDPADEFHSPYVVVGGDPVNLVDPDGRQSCDITLWGENGSSVTNETHQIDAEVDVPVDWGENYTLEGEGVLLASLDIFGTLDPTPFSDGLAASIYASQGSWLDAGISVVAMAPYFGDGAKLTRLPRSIKAIQLALKRKTVNLSGGRHALIIDQAESIVEQTGRSNIEIRGPEGIYRYDLRGRSHAGHRTPHVQRSLYNTAPDGARYVK
jgi:hypothetical protein